MKNLTWKEELDTGVHKCITCNKKLNSDDILFMSNHDIINKTVNCSDCGTVHRKIGRKLVRMYRSLNHKWSKINININKGKKLTHHLHCINGNWYWVCPICGEWLAPHRMDIHTESFKVLQSKGAASRHLMRHDPSLVQHGRKINDILKKPKMYKNCKNCGHELDEFQIYGLCRKCLVDTVVFNER